MAQSSEKSFKCPYCGGTVTGKNESELVKQVQQHAKKVHNMDQTEQEAKDFMASKSKTKMEM